MTISNLMKMAESMPNGLKTLWEKDKLLVMSNLSFSHHVFKRLVLQTCKKKGLVWERVKTTSSLGKKENPERDHLFPVK